MFFYRLVIVVNYESLARTDINIQLEKPLLLKTFTQDGTEWEHPCIKLLIN